MVAGIAKPYGFVIVGPARAGQTRAGDPEEEGRAAFPSSGDTLLPAASFPSNLLGDGVSSVRDSLRQIPFRRRRAHPIFLETVLLLGATPDDIFQDFTPIGLFVVADSRAAAPSPPIFLEAASLWRPPLAAAPCVRRLVLRDGEISSGVWYFVGRQQVLTNLHRMEQVFRSQPSSVEVLGLRL